MDLVLQENNKVDLRQLHKELGIKTDFRHYVKRTVIPYGFEEGYDYEKVSSINNGAVQYDYICTLDMAKELCMISKTEMGKRLRKYFIEVEKQYQAIDPETAKELRKIILTDNPRSFLTVGKQIDALLKQYQAVKQENDKLTKLQYQLDTTYCISDIVQRFKDIEPWEAQSLLYNEGILEWRKNGFFPSEFYDKNNNIISVLDANRGRYYPRYTIRGVQFVEDFLLNRGYEFK